MKFNKQQSRAVSTNSKMVIWTKEKITQLIELYRKSECLWNCWHESYKNKEKRNRAIEDICKSLKITKFDFGKKIHNLRNQFNSEMKKMEQRIEEAGGNVDDKSPAVRCKWGHFEALLFLKDVIEPRPGSNSFTTPKAKKIRLHTEDDNEDLSVNNINAGEDTSHFPYEETETDEECLLIHIKSNEEHMDEADAADFHSTHEDESNDLKFTSLTTTANPTKTINPNDSSITQTIANTTSHNIHPITRSSISVPVTTTQSLTTTTNSRCMGDQWDAFGDLIATELRNFNSDISRKKLKRKIMQAILEVGEEDDKLIDSYANMRQN